MASSIPGSGTLSPNATYIHAVAFAIGVVPHINWNLTGTVLPSLKRLVKPLVLMGCRYPPNAAPYFYATYVRVSLDVLPALSVA